MSLSMSIAINSGDEEDAGSLIRQTVSAIALLDFISVDIHFGTT